MGNGQSEFEQQFYDRYSFIQLLEDTHYGPIKIYRKNFLNYDYIMILQSSLETLSQQQLNALEEQLQLIRSYQVNNILKVYHYRMLQQNKIECQGATVKIYAEYYNHTLSDYLTALRAKKVSLTIDEVVYILKSVVNALIAFRKMHIWEIEINARNLFLSMEGQVFLSPLLFVKSSFLENQYHRDSSLSLEKKYQKFSLKDHPLYSFPEKTQLIHLFLELTGYLSHSQFPQSHQFFICIKQSPSLDVLYQWIPDSKVQALLVENTYGPFNQENKQNSMFSFENTQKQSKKE